MYHQRVLVLQLTFQTEPSIDLLFIACKRIVFFPVRRTVSITLVGRGSGLPRQTDRPTRDWSDACVVLTVFAPVNSLM